jgi:hypothetical protein
VLGAASLATACTSLGTVTATWDLQDWNDATGQPTAAACPAGADTAIVYALPDGDTNAADADKDLFNCSDGVGTTAGHIAGTYDVWVEITDHSGAQLFAQSNAVKLNVSDGTNSGSTFSFQVNRGYVSAAWTLKGVISGNTLDCTSAAVPAVEIDNMVGTATPISDQFNCTMMQGTVNPLPLATYAVALQAIDSSNPPVGLGPAASAGTADLQFGNQLKDVGTVVVSVDGK